MIEGFDVKEQALGTGDTKVYTFSFRIYELTDLLIWVQDASGDVVGSYRGDDTTFLAGVEIDDDGGGTITLADFLPDEYVMTMLLAIDDPDQPASFLGKFTLDLQSIEGALDFLASCIQSAVRRGLRAVVLHDLDDLDNFDPTLPIGLGNYPGGIVSVNQEGSGFECVASLGSLVGGFFVTGTRAAPIDYGAATPIPNGGQLRQLHFIESSGGAVVSSANPQIAAGSIVGQEMVLYGCDDTKTFQLSNGNGLSLASNCILSANKVLGLIWNGSVWSELYRR